MDTNEKINKIAEKELEEFKYVLSVWNLYRNRNVKLLKQSLKIEASLENKTDFVDYLHEILRASIVFLHSSLETYLREIVRIKLKFDGNLNGIPLSDTPGYKNGKEKFNLVELARHKEKTVAEILNISIDNYLANLSFNSTNDISSIFLQIGLPLENLSQHFPMLDKVMKRRHRIVHEGDRTTNSLELNTVNGVEVTSWIDGAGSFIEDVAKIMIKNVYMKKIHEALLKDSISLTEQDVSRIVQININSEIKF